MSERAGAIAPTKLFNRQYVFFTLVNLLVSVSFSMVSTTMSRYAHNLGMAVATAGAITGAFSIASMVIRPFSGYVNDRFDRKGLLVLSTGAMALCTFGYGFFSSYGGLLTLRLLHGAAFAFSSTVNMAVIPGIVPEKRVGEAVSYFGVVQSVAMAAGPSIGLGLAQIGGFRLNFSASALLALVGALMAVFLCRFGEQGEKRTAHRRPRLSDIIAKECLVYTLVDIAIASASGLENSMIALYGEQLGMGNIGWYFTISAVTLCVTRILFGRIADRRGTAFALYPGLLLMVVGFLLLFRPAGAWMFAAAAVIKTLGVALARPAIQAACLKAVPPERRGSAASTFYIGSDIGQGTSPAIGGKIVDMTGGTDYGLAFAWYALPLALAGGLYAIWEKRKRAK
ncbi:MAG: MFS transporter [Oscillospiraceae bacterium]|nr:MFS transporter [Oscillospiraceae bacterium]